MSGKKPPEQMMAALRAAGYRIEEPGKTPSARKQEERARMRKRGFVLRQFWIHPKDWTRVQTYLRRVNKRREDT